MQCQGCYESNQIQLTSWLVCLLHIFFLWPQWMGSTINVPWNSHHAWSPGWTSRVLEVITMQLCLFLPWCNRLHCSKERQNRLILLMCWYKQKHLVTQVGGGPGAHSGKQLLTWLLQQDPRQALQGACQKCQGQQPQPWSRTPELRAWGEISVCWKIRLWRLKVMESKTVLGSIPKTLEIFSYKVCVLSVGTRKKGLTWGKLREQAWNRNAFWNNTDSRQFKNMDENVLVWIVSPQNSHGEALIPRLTIFGEKIFKEVIRIKCKRMRS